MKWSVGSLGQGGPEPIIYAPGGRGGPITKEFLSKAGKELPVTQKGRL